MIFVAIVVLVLIAIIFAAINARKNWDRTVGAEYERVKREEPDSPLAQLGENEFRLGYEKAVQKRNNRAALMMLLASPVLIGGFFWTMMNFDSFAVQLVMMLIAIGGVVFVYKWAIKSGPSIQELMVKSRA